MEGKQRGRLMPTRLRIALAAIFGSGALLVVGSLLPWTTWVIDHSTLIVYGLRASGGYTLMIGAVVLAIGALLLQPSRRVRWSIGAMYLYLFGLLISAVHVARVPSPPPASGTFSAGIGVWICVIASSIGGRAQPVIATSSASFSDGFMNPRVSRGRLLRLRANRARSSALWIERSVPFGMY